MASLGVRPPRVAVLVPRIPPWSHLTLLEAALASQSRTWGGHGNLVIPWTYDLKDRPLFWGIIERFDPDVFVIYVPTWSEVAEFDPKYYCEFTEREHAKFAREHDQQTADTLIQQIDGFAVVQRRLEPDWPVPLLKRLAPFHSYDGEALVVHEISGASAPMAPAMDAIEFVDLPSAVMNRTGTGVLGRLLVTANLGRLTGATRDAARARGVVITEPPPLRKLDWARAAVEGKQSADALAAWSFAENGLARYTPRVDPGVSALVVGDTAWDFSLYYALKRMAGQAWWLPSWLRGNKWYMWRLLTQMERAPGHMGHELAVTTASSSPIRDAVARDLRTTSGEQLPARVADWQEMLPEVPSRIFEQNNIGRPESLEIVDGKTLRLDTPIPRAVTTVPPSNMRWVVEVSSPEWSPVRHPRLGVEVLHSPLYGPDQVRTTREGVAYLCPNAFIWNNEPLESAVARPVLEPLPLLAQLERIGASTGWRVSSSDKGAYALEAGRLFGGPTGLSSALRDCGLRTIFDAYLTKSGVPGLWLSQDGRRYLTWSSFEKIVGTEVAGEHVQRLLEAKALERGVILKCERCRQQAWYDLERLSDTFRCGRCRVSQPVEKHWVAGHEPIWYYRLAEVVYQFLVHDGDLPLLVVAEAFDETAPLQQSYELEVHPPTGKNLEFDIFVSERSRLWIGEANRTGEFDTARIEKLLEVARTFGAHGMILATRRATFPQKTRKAISVALKGIAYPELRLVPNVNRRKPSE